MAKSPFSDEKGTRAMTQVLKRPEKSVRSGRTLPSFLQNRKLRLIIFSGKGGTGKTTASVATAIALCKFDAAKKVALVSVDPAHSISDSLGVSVGTGPCPVEGVPGLWAMELDPADLLKDFKGVHVREITEAVKRAGFYGQIDMKEFLSFSLPGMEEIMILFQIAQMLQSGRDAASSADVIVLDTAPTGHTLRLLELPQVTDQWVEALNRALEKYRVHPRFYTSGSRYEKGDFVDRFVEKIRTSINTVREILTDAQITEFVPVMIPEALSLAETEDLLAVLKQKQISVKTILINRVRVKRNCPLCSSKEEDQARTLEEIGNRLSGYEFLRIPLFAHEIQGRERLKKVWAVILEDRERLAVKPAKPRAATLSQEDGTPLRIAAKKRMILFAGKGGVGKTSLAAATSIDLARRHPKKKILLYSIDPAHSLSDSLDFSIGEEPTSVPERPNLFAMEVNADALLKRFLEEYQSLIRDAFDTWEEKKQVKMEIRFDRNLLATYVRTFPPGLLDVLAFERMMEFVESHEFDTYVVDTAPTGHLLKLFESPLLVRDWMRYVYRGLIKYQIELPLTELQELGRKILKSTNRVRNLLEILSDPKASEVITVTIPEAMSVEETTRLIGAVQEMGMSCRQVIVNMVTPRLGCDFCAEKREGEERYIQKLRAQHPARSIVLAPLFVRQVRGRNCLSELADQLCEKNKDKGGRL